jgi:hypothetical protein
MSNYAMVNNQTNIVDTVIVWDGVTPYTPPEGYTLVELPAPNETEPTPGAGWSYVDGVFEELVALPPEDAPNVIAD